MSNDHTDTAGEDNATGDSSNVARMVMGFLIEPSPYKHFRKRRNDATTTNTQRPPVLLDADAIVKRGRKTIYPFAYLQPGEGFEVPAHVCPNHNSVASAANAFTRLHTFNTWEMRVGCTLRGTAYVTRTR